MTARCFAFLLAGAILAPSAMAQSVKKPTTYGASALDASNARLEQDAIDELKSNPGGNAWFVDLDMVFPNTREEYEALGKYVILEFNIFSNDQSELPLSKVYVGGVALNCPAVVPRDVPSASATAKAFGKFRMDSLCVLPMEVDHLPSLFHTFKRLRKEGADRCENERRIERFIRELIRPSRPRSAE